MTQAHSLCAHVAASTAQPLCSITGAHGREQFSCVVCSATTIGAMVQNLGTATTANAVRFDRCNHGLNPRGAFCPTCFQGVTSYLNVVRTMAIFSDKPFSNRLTHLIRKLRTLHPDTGI